MRWRIWTVMPPNSSLATMIAWASLGPIPGISCSSLKVAELILTLGVITSGTLIVSRRENSFGRISVPTLRLMMCSDTVMSLRLRVYYEKILGLSVNNIQANGLN
jgi:hypothetical protein